MDKKKFLDSLTDVYCRLAVTEHGVGVVAIRPIPEGVDPFKNCDLSEDTLKISEEELETSTAPEEAKELVRDFCALQNGVYFVPGYGIDAIDKSYFLNHSRNPNMGSNDSGETFFTLQPISKGDELTIDYRTYHETKSFAL